MIPTQPVWEFRSRRRVEFADTDMGGLVHFSRFFVFLETAEHEFIRSLGSSMHFELDGSEYGWPRVAASCEYIAPVRYEDELDIRLLVARKGRSSMHYAFVLANGTGVVARGRLSSVCCRFREGGGLEAVNIPTSLADQISQAPPEALEAAGFRDA